MDGTASSTFIVTFTPIGKSSARAATLRIARNDANESPFDMALTGSAYSTTADVDGDGLNDWAELQLAALGFNWQTSSTGLVTALRTNASAAGYFTTAPFAGPHSRRNAPRPGPGEPAIHAHAESEKIHGFTNLQPHPIAAPATLTDEAVNFEFLFTSPEPKALFKMQVE